MEVFWKALAAVLITLLLVPALGRDLGIALTAIVCCMVGTGAFLLLEPVLAFLRELEAAAGMDPELLGTLLKLVGIGLVGEIAGVLCEDTGCGALGKGLQLLTCALILSLSIPILRSFTQLIREILGGL